MANSDLVGRDPLEEAGAVSGGAVNYLFISHIQNLARAHFIIKRLEGAYGTSAVRLAYDNLNV